MRPGDPHEADPAGPGSLRHLDSGDPPDRPPGPAQAFLERRHLEARDPLVIGGAGAVGIRHGLKIRVPATPHHLAAFRVAAGVRVVCGENRPALVRHDLPSSLFHGGGSAGIFRGDSSVHLGIGRRPHIVPLGRKPAQALQCQGARRHGLGPQRIRGPLRINFHLEHAVQVFFQVHLVDHCEAAGGRAPQLQQSAVGSDPDGQAATFGGRQTDSVLEASAGAGDFDPCGAGDELVRAGLQTQTHQRSRGQRHGVVEDDADAFHFPQHADTEARRPAARSRRGGPQEEQDESGAHRCASSHSRLPPS